MRLEGAHDVAQGGAKRNPGEWGMGKNCVMRLEGAHGVTLGNGGKWRLGIE